MTQPRDFKLDTDGDLIVPIQWVSGIDAVAQAIRIRVRLVAGEWFRDLTAGVDWYGTILGQRYNDSVIREEIRGAISAVSGVGSILSLTTSYDRDARSLSIGWRVQVDLDELAGEVNDSVQVAA